MLFRSLLPHNFVIDRTTNTLHIIDLDEGGVNIVPRREMPAKNTNENLKWFIALQYPNPLREGNRELYTKIQFTAAFLLLTKKFELDQELAELLVVATDLGNILLTADTPGARVWHKNKIEKSGILGQITLIDKKINMFLGVEDG